MTLNEIDNQLREIQVFRLSDYPRTVEIALQTLAQSREIGYMLGIVTSLNHLAWAYNRLEQYSNAIHPAKEALLLSREHGLREAEGFAIRNIILHLHISRQYEEVIRSLHIQIAIGEEVGNTDLIASGYYDLGVAYSVRNEFEVSNRYYERAVHVAVQGDNLCYVYLGLAYNLSVSGSSEQELEYLHKALDTARSSSFTFGITLTLSYLTEFYLRNNNIERAVEFAAQINPTSLEFAIQQATITHKLGQPVKAIHLIEDILAKFELLELDRFYQKLADIYAEMGDFESAHRCIKRVNIEITLRYERHIASQIETVSAIHELEMLKHELAEKQRTENERIARQRAEIELAQHQDITHIKRELLIRMSHEFRTPLAVIRTSLDMLNRYSDRLTPERKAEHNEKIDTQYALLEQLLRRILSVLRLDNAKLPFEDQPLYPDQSN